MKEDIVKLSHYEGCEALVSPCKRGECDPDGLECKPIRVSATKMADVEVTTGFIYFKLGFLKKTKSKQSRTVRIWRTS